jgi:DNA-binding GntR family transcriptional regulator
MLSIPEEELNSASIKNVLQIQFGLPTLNTEWHMNSLGAKGELAKILQVKPETMCNSFDVYSYTLRNEPLFFHRYIAPCNDRVMKIIT